MNQLTEEQRQQIESKSVMRRLEQQGAICRECKIERGYRPILDYVRLCPRHARMDDAATAMRDACVEKLRGLLHKSEPDDSRWNAALYHAEKQIESLTLDQVQEQS